MMSNILLTLLMKMLREADTLMRRLVLEIPTRVLWLGARGSGTVIKMILLPRRDHADNKSKGKEVQWKK